MGAFIFISFVQPQSFCGDFSFSWRGMTLYSASCSVVNVCRLFAQIYAALCMFYSFFVSLCAFVCGFCARCVAFSYVYDFFVCMLYGFYVRIRLLCALSGFCVRIWLIFCAHCAAFAYVYGLSSELVVRILCTIMAYLHDVQCGQSQGIQSCRFLDFFCTYAHD